MDEGARGTVTAPDSQSCGVLRGLDPLHRAQGDHNKFPRATEHAEIKRCAEISLCRNIWRSILQNVYQFNLFCSGHKSLYRYEEETGSVPGKGPTEKGGKEEVPHGACARARRGRIIPLPRAFSEGCVLFDVADK